MVPLMGLRFGVAERELKCLGDRGRVDECLLGNLLWSCLALLHIVKPVSEEVILDVIRDGPELVILSPASVRHEIVHVVPILLAFFWVIRHDSVRFPSLTNGDPDRAFLRGFVSMEISVLFPAKL